ncbi:hypothetical protein F5Y18DRAFT_424931 [Xylariaceae sp. FL1019]|nr:hypothetical protein F5Y18DRAFT_424931 [Xylariaceae sp. FL1019]
MSFQNGCESYDVDQSGVLTARFPRHYGRPDAKLDLNTCIGMGSNFWGPFLQWNASNFVHSVSEIKLHKSSWQVQMECKLKDGGFLPTSKWASINLEQYISIDGNFQLVFSPSEYVARQKKMADEQAELAKKPQSFTDGVKEGWGQGGWIGGIVGGIGSFF